MAGQCQLACDGDIAGMVRYDFIRPLSWHFCNILGEADLNRVF